MPSCGKGIYPLILEPTYLINKMNLRPKERTHMCKKCIALLLSCTLLLVALSGCGTPAASGKIEGTLEEIMAKVQKDAGIEMAVMDMPITEENFTSFLFIDPVTGGEALASEAAMSAIAHSIVLLRVPADADGEKLATEIKEKADPRKWICVEAEKTEVKRHGDLILLVMSTTAITDKVIANFDALAK